MFIFALAYELSVSYALFESEKEIIVNSDIGKWDITVNGSALNETTTFSVDSVKVSSDPNVREDYFAPGTSGYFTITIDPGDTDVSIYFEIVCRTDMINNPQIHLTRIENYQRSDLVNVGAFTYAGVIPLADIENNLGTTTLNFYITWDNNDNNNEIDSLYGNSSSNFNLPMQITFRQYLGETFAPTSSPVSSPTASPAPTAEPTSSPTSEPTIAPTATG